MKKLTLILAAVAWFAMQATAQVPHGIKYQTIVRSPNGEAISNQQVALNVEILQGIFQSTPVCSELFFPVTNEYGLVNIVIGSQDQAAFNAIDWSTGPYSVRIRLNGTLMGASELLSVPYALYAEKSGDSGSADLWSSNGEDIYIDHGNVGIGTAYPSAKLDIRGSFYDEGVALRIGSNDGMHFLNLFGGRENDPNPYIWWKSGDPLRFATDEGGFSEKMRITSDGKVGIANIYPKRQLEIGGTIEGFGVEVLSGSPDAAILRFGDNTGWKLHFGRSFESPGGILNTGSQGALMTIVDNGNVGIGTKSPESKLDVRGDIITKGVMVIDLREFSGPGGRDGLRILSSNDNDQGVIITNKAAFSLWSESLNHLADFNCSRASVSVLEIRGGSDLAEPFPIASALEEGSVVIIDETNPGHLVASSQPYDRKVAGIVSGAGGVMPGLTLKQEGVMEGTQNIALTGRVYVKATAENGAIRPGDRLTTSSLPGHAMKATDDAQCPGSVIGKAMSSLENGEGLVLVLVNLQ